MDIVAEANGSYKRKQGGTSASFSKKVADGIKLSGDGASISLYPKIPTQVRQPVVTGEIGKLPLKSLLYSAENINSLDKKTVSYYYNDSTSLEYSLTYTGFKEDIVVSEYTGQTEYVFTLKTGGLALTGDNGNFYLTDKNGNTKATLGQVIIFTADEKNNAFGRMSAAAVKENEEYTVTIHVDAEYLKDEKTVYPIRIDPTIELTESGTSLVEDVVVNSNDTVSHRTTEALRVGKNEDGTYSRILIKFNYDFGSFADGPLKIHRAYVEMRDVMCQTESMTVMSEMYIGTNWSEDADWSAIARGVHTHYMASMPINYNKGNGYTEKHRYSISVLDAVKYWVAEANNTPDYYQASPQGGIMIKAYDAVEQGTTPIQKYFASSQYAETAYRPSLSVTYYDTHTQYSDPFGHLDAVTSNSIRGWVWCVDLPNESVPVTIYLKNKTTGETYPGITLTGEDTALYRPDVHDGGYGTGCYGFNYPIDWNKYSAGEYEVRAKWHSMNGTGLVYDLFNSPKGYDNLPLQNGEYYINNKSSGKFVQYSGRKLNAVSGQVSEIKPNHSHEWVLEKHNGGYYIHSAMYANMSTHHYLSVSTEQEGSEITVLEFSSSQADALPSNCIWDVIEVNGKIDGVMLQNRYNGGYLYLDNYKYYINDSIAISECSNDDRYLWRVVSTNDYGSSDECIYKQLTKDAFFGGVDVMVGDTVPIPYSVVIDNVLWAEPSDFIYKLKGTVGANTIASISPLTGEITGVNVGRVTFEYTHKVTGESDEFIVDVHDRLPIGSGNLEIWNAVSHNVGYWSGNEVKVFMDPLDSEGVERDYFLRAVRDAVCEWNRVLGDYIDVIIINNPDNTNESVDRDDAGIYICCGSDGEITNATGISDFKTTLGGSSSTLISDKCYFEYDGIKKIFQEIHEDECYIRPSFKYIADDGTEKEVKIEDYNHYKTVVTHELGHALGYSGHVDSKLALMYPFSASGSPYTLTDEEASYMRQIYSLRGDVPN